ncbi:protein bicaudal C isoform X2 [Rhodnius prolixus]
MQETKTHIAWPSRLKLGAKSKKDPHIRVIGRAEDVKAARERIVAALDTKSNRVNMKIDVSYTDHSHIIGKGGLTIKKVMEDTGCHIHFPDSNRNNPTEKSNQVSIAGEVWGVEKARARVRELTPLIFCFELPILGALSLASDCYSAYIKSLQEKYNVQVMFRTRQKLNSTLVVVKGSEWEVARVKDATQLLINQMCTALTDQVLVHMMVEISPQHHSIVLGKNNENLKTIMQNTSTQIIFLDPSDPNIPSLKKSNVTITGSIHNVYKARQQLIGSLPIVLMFDVPENSVAINSVQVSDLMTKLDVLITVRHKPKQNVFSFIIKGIERNVSSIYEARRKLIAPNDPPLKVEIPSTYFIPNAGPLFKTIWNFPVYPELPSSPLMLGPIVQQTSPGENVWPSLPHLMMAAQHVPVLTSLSQPTHHRLHQHLQQQRHHLDHLGHFSYSSLSLPELPVYSSSNTSSVSSPCVSPRTVSPVPHNVPEPAKIDSTSRFSDQVERKAPGFDRPMLTPGDYQRKKIHAHQALQKPVSCREIRVPNSSWFGYGFSQSSPTAALREQKIIDEKRAVQEWLGNGGVENDYSSTQNNFDIVSSRTNVSDDQPSVSNYLEAVSQATLSSITNLDSQDLYTILATVGLEKYSQLFKKHEIDTSTFRTLTENDLKEIGISMVGPRRKIMICIAELNNRERNPMRGSAAPGAERRSSSTTSLNENW